MTIIIASKYKATIAISLVILSIIAVSGIYYWNKTRTTTSIAEDLTINKVRINRRTDTLIAVNITNTGSQSLTIVEIKLVKIQAGLVIASEQLDPHITIYPASNIEIDVSFSLDPEGADYRIIAVTEKGEITTFIFGYP